MIIIEYPMIIIEYPMIIIEYPMIIIEYPMIIIEYPMIINYSLLSNIQNNKYLCKSPFIEYEYSVESWGNAPNCHLDQLYHPLLPYEYSARIMGQCTKLSSGPIVYFAKVYICHLNTYL